MSRVRSLIRSTPGAGRITGLIRSRQPGFATSAYWESRYERGGDSGAGSYGAIAKGKADFLNSLVDREAVASVVELGCGDGHQLTLSTYPRYCGLDVSPTAVRLCIERHRDDPTKSFFLYDPSAFHDPLGLLRADMAISLDVLYHLVEPGALNRHLDDLFGLATSLVVIFATDEDHPANSRHIRYRKFTGIVAERFPHWTLAETTPHPLLGEVPAEDLTSSFFVFRRLP